MQAHLPLTPEEVEWRQRHLRLTARLRPHPLASALGVTATSYVTHGEDRSSYQGIGGDVPPKGFLIAKATEGTSYVDKNFAGNRAYARGKNVPFGIYHFFHGNADAEFQHMMNVVKTVGPNEWILNDNEVSWNKAAIARFGQLAQGVSKRNGLYSFMGMISANDTSGLPVAQGGPIDFVHPAAYQSTPPGGDRWGAPLMWQHTDGQFGQVDAGCDCSALTGFGAGGTTEQLSAYLGAGPPPPPPPPPPSPGRIVIVGNQPASQLTTT